MMRISVKWMTTNGRRLCCALAALLCLGLAWGYTGPALGQSEQDEYERKAGSQGCVAGV